MKKILTIAVVVIVLIFLLSLAKDFLIKSIVSTVATQVTGAKVEIGWLSLGLLSQSSSISNFRMYNPAGFSRSIMVDLPKIAVKINSLALLRGKLHLRLLTVDLKEIGLEKNKEGKLNVDSLKFVQQEPKQAKEKASSKSMPMQIDEFNLVMGRIVSKDYTGSKEPSISVYNINLKKTYKNINSAQQLVALILSEPLKQAGIKAAAIHSAALLTGVGVIPIAVISTFGEKDHAVQNFNLTIDKIYDLSLSTLKDIGKIKKENKAKGEINAEVDGANITLKLKGVSAKKTEVTVSARKMMLPKPEIASGILYRISEKLK
ncbi:MAG: hypothetical protein AB1629_05510 [Candidatus Omnitrophota bacterium]